MRFRLSWEPSVAHESPSRQIAWFLAFYVCFQWGGIDSYVLDPRIPFIVTDDLRRPEIDLARFRQAVSTVGGFSMLFGFLRDRWPWGDRRLFLLLIPILAAVPASLLLGGVTYARLLAGMVLTVAVSATMGAAFNATLATMGRRFGAVGRLAGLYGAGGALLGIANVEIGGALAGLPLETSLGLLPCSRSSFSSLPSAPPRAPFLRRGASKTIRRPCGRWGNSCAAAPTAPRSSISWPGPSVPPSGRRSPFG